MWTAFNYVASQAQLKYSFMIKDVRLIRDQYKSFFFGSQKELESSALAVLSKGDSNAASALLANNSEKLTAAVLKDWWALSEQLYIRSNDGYLNTHADIVQPAFYSSWWLKH